MSFWFWWSLSTNIIWATLCFYNLREWRKSINLVDEVLELNGILMEMMNIPQESELYDQEEDV